MCVRQEVAAYLRSRQPGEAVLGALTTFLQADSYLLEVDANERSMAFRLAMHLQARLPDWHIDVEYNRDGVDPKKLEHFDLSPNEEDTEAKTVFPDIIVHLRGTAENYLAIELKKTTNRVA